MAELRHQLYRRLDNYVRFAMEALEDGDCARAFKAVIKANAALGLVQGIYIGMFGGTKAALRAVHADTHLRDIRRALSLVERAYVERCYGGDGGTLHGLGSPSRARGTRVAAEKLPPSQEGLRQRITALLDDVKNKLDEGDCVDTFYAIRDAANYIFYMTAMMKLVSKSATSLVTEKAITKSITQYLAPLEALEHEFVDECVKGGAGRAEVWRKEMH